jgi:hypothetical protein
MSVRKVSETGKGDEYYTPDYVVEILLPYLKKTNYKTIWCPFDKEWSEYVKIFKREGYKVIYSHIDNGEDFLIYTPDEPFDIVISNPPFSIKQQVFEKLVALEKPFAILMSATSVQGAGFVQTLSLASDMKFILFDRRISYSGDRPPFPSWYFTNMLLEKNEFYIYNEKPEIMYTKWKESIL